MISPPNTRAGGYISENAPLPLGICYIAAVLRENGFETDLFDFGDVTEISENYLKSVSFFEYDVYGFTSYTKTFPASLKILRQLRKQNSRAIIVFGGPHASPCAREILAEYPEINFVIRNEGEVPMLYLMNCLTSGTPMLSEIPNLTYRQNEPLFQEQRDISRIGLLPIVETPASDKLQDLDSFPHPYRKFIIEPSRISYEHRRHSEPVEVAFVASSRGCPKKCSFCSIVVMSPKYRFRSVGSLMKEIKELYDERPFGHINFLDANFFCHVPRTLEFSRTLYEWKKDLTWSGTATADMVSRHATILPEIGCRNCAFLEIGIESGNNETLARFNKRTTVEDNKQAVKILQRAGIEIALDFIMFDPETTLENLRQNLMFLWECDLFGYSPPECLFNGMRLYPGTPARDKYISLFGLSGYHLDSIDPPFQNPEVAEAYARAENYFNKVQNGAMQTIQALEIRRRELLNGKPFVSKYNIKQAQMCVAAIVKLNHAPYRFFDSMLTDLENRNGSRNADGSEIDCKAIDRANSIVAQAKSLL